MVTYGDFKRWLHTASNGDTESRNRANGQLLKFRGDAPEQYQKYLDKARQETKSQNIIKC